MRTTIDLPEAILRRAKIVAIERGTSLKELVGQALTRELAAPKSGKPKPTRVKLPIFKSKSPGVLKSTNADLKKLDLQEDLKRHGISA